MISTEKTPNALPIRAIRIDIFPRIDQLRRDSAANESNHQ